MQLPELKLKLVLRKREKLARLELLNSKLRPRLKELNGKLDKNN